MDVIVADCVILTRLAQRRVLEEAIRLPHQMIIPDVMFVDQLFDLAATTGRLWSIWALEFGRLDGRASRALTYRAQYPALSTTTETSLWSWSRRRARNRSCSPMPRHCRHRRGSWPRCPRAPLDPRRDPSAWSSRRRPAGDAVVARGLARLLRTCGERRCRDSRSHSSSERRERPRRQQAASARQVRHLTQADLARRWRKSQRTFEGWRAARRRAPAPVDRRRALQA